MYCEASAAMNFPDLERLVRPASIAVIGASVDNTKGPGRIIPMLQSFGYSGGVFPVNAKYDEINGLRSYATVTDLPEIVDLAVVMVPAASVVEVVTECAERGVKFAMILSSGFGETDSQGVLLQEQLTAVARRTGMRIYGPNCPGLLSFKDRSGISFSPRQNVDAWRPGRTALVTQGGAIGRVFMDAMETHGTPGLNYWFSPGNEADLDIADFVGWLAGQDDTDLVLMVVESFRRGGYFIEAARAARLAGKGVCVLKIGRSEAGARATATHTAALTGADRVADAAFKQAGVVRVDDADELLDIARLVERYGVRRCRNVGVISVSGGSAALLADACGIVGLTVDSPRPETERKLAEMLPSLAAVGNPVDLTTGIFGNPNTVGDALLCFLSDPNIDAVVMPFPYDLGRINDIMAQQLAIVAAESRKPIIVVGMSEAVLGSPAAQIVRAAGIPFVPSAMKAAIALRRYADLAESVPLPVTAAERTPMADLSLLEGTLTEECSEALLARYGIEFAPSEVVSSMPAAVTAAGRLGYPVVLKAAGEGIAHKSEAGLVTVGIQDETALAAAFDDITEKYLRLTGNDEVQVKVAAMITGGLETMCGLHVDPSFGPVVTFGLGGIYAEVLDDVAMRVCPITPVEARAMIDETKASKIIAGARGGNKLDVDKLSTTLSALSQFGHDWRHRLVGADINPLMVRTAGAIGLDALIILDNEK
jgi:acyl-CoA synthetase (NDP forming)